MLVLLQAAEQGDRGFAAAPVEASPGDHGVWEIRLVEYDGDGLAQDKAPSETCAAA
jgi:hypothetical protein